MFSEEITERNSIISRSKALKDRLECELVDPDQRIGAARAAVLFALAQLGLPEYADVRTANANVVFWAGDGLVAKAAEGEHRKALGIEAKLVASLSRLGAPTVRPASAGIGPFRCGDWDVIFTERLQENNTVPSQEEVLESLAELHSYLHVAEPESFLPDWTGVVRSAIDKWDKTSLAPDESQLVEQVFNEYVVETLDWNHDGRILHGDVWQHQVLATDDGLKWLDFEDACRGPLEWDLATFSDPKQFGRYDVGRWQHLRVVKNWCVAVWMNDKSLENPRRSTTRMIYLNRLRQVNSSNPPER